jgi:hypothetical protein
MAIDSLNILNKLGLYKAFTLGLGWYKVGYKALDKALDKALVGYKALA